MPKKIIFTFAFLFAAYTMFAQYALEKQKFDYRTYTPQHGDRYIPFLAGTFSYLLPGGGLFYCGEVPRGLAFVGGYATVIIVMSTMLDATNAEDVVVGTFLSFAALHIWSIVDASRVAKVKTLALRAKDEESSMIFLKPKLFFTNTQDVKTLGVSLNVTF